MTLVKWVCTVAILKGACMLLARDAGPFYTLGDFGVLY